MVELLALEAQVAVETLEHRQVHQGLLVLLVQLILAVAVVVGLLDRVALPMVLAVMADQAS
jgi:hypothetical protein